MVQTFRKKVNIIIHDIAIAKTHLSFSSWRYAILDEFYKPGDDEQ